MIISWYVITSVGARPFKENALMNLIAGNDNMVWYGIW